MLFIYLIINSFIYLFVYLHFMILCLLTIIMIIKNIYIYFLFKIYHTFFITNKIK